MKWCVASDIHGSARWCRALLEAFEREEADRLLLLGDLLYHGPRNALPEEYDPRAVAAMLNGLRGRALCVRGNCEAEVDQMLLSFPVLAEYALLDAGSRLLFATHGHIWGPDRLPPLSPGDVLLYGHTHVPACEERDGVLCCNPGSVSIPKGGSGHSYMTFDGAQLVWRDLDGTETRRHVL